MRPPPTLALTVVDTVYGNRPMAQKPGDKFVEPPAVVTTPCEPWPPPYYLEDGFRRVKPYHWTYNTYCKERWRDREILDIFADEFRDKPIEYYVG